ncbi:TetR/AcrR family transcriptional regulator [Dietzia maris]|jgi:AcrR family transcriptional regulator|uniref:TetR/AcrR family transcriptional regulator n=1 Tax=Dietzia TaxID=37914 RepID=UPI0022B4B287|nr:MULTISPECIES: helix-turn-helix domain-containing protein [Dietzia]MCZ4539464.1 helix-turn-helix domain containing protein [Dietzia maris]MCZ4656071.1 helix-turn-helix domain containing protein [Dietzia kunjamensis]MDJ0422684.1 helix-turn-helix domain-containing protein [Dietzia kunjamensis]MDV3354562.1 helix-turn-helix domain-containing protein [Dietzia sp. IN118]
MERPAPDRPVGRDAVRHAVLGTARRVFAARGPRAPLRLVAEAAGVNLGLIHRHIGNKDDLLAAVLEDGLRHGTARVAEHDDAGRAIRSMLTGATANPDFSRLLVWLSLDPDSVARPLLDASTRPARAVARMTDPPPTGDLQLALALTVVYAWPVLREQVLDVLEIAPADRADVDDRMAALLSEVVTGVSVEERP